MLVWCVCRRMEMLLLPEYHLEELPQLDQDLSCKHPPRWPLHDDHKTVRCFGHAESRTQGWDWHGMVHTPVVTVVRGRLLTSKCMEQQQNQYISFRSCLSFLIFLDAHNAHSLPPSPWHSTAHAPASTPGEFGMFAGSRCEVSVPFPAKYPLWEAQTGKQCQVEAGVQIYRNGQH